MRAGHVRVGAIACLGLAHVGALRSERAREHFDDGAYEPDLDFAHTFEAGEMIRALFATSQGRYTLWALDRACDLPIDLGPNEEGQVTLSIDSNGTAPSR